MEEGFAKKCSLSSSSSLWASRLSPLAQPFTMKRQASQPQALSSLTNSNPNLNQQFDPSTSNHFDDPISDSLFQNSLSNLIDLDDDQLFLSTDSALSALAVPFDAHNWSDSQTQSKLLKGFCGSESNPESSNVLGSSRFESLLKQDSKLNLSEVSVAPDVSNIAPMFGSSITTNSTSLGNTFAPKNDSLYGKEIFDRSAASQTERNVTTEDVRFSAKNSVKSSNENEEDLDSPCWKGIQNYARYFDRASEPLYPLRSQSEASPSLNPEAPQFVPSRAKGAKIYPQKEHPSFKPSLNEQRLVSSLKAGPKPPGFSHSSRTYEPLKNTSTSSVPNPTQMTKSRLSNSIYPDRDREGFSEGIKEALHNIQASFPLIDTENIPTSLNDFTEMLQYLSHSLSSCPNINVSMMVKAIHYLSESLIQNYSRDFGSLNDHDHDMIRDIIDNLSVPIKHQTIRKTPNVDYRAKSTEILEPSKIDFGVTRSKDLVVRPNLESQSNRNWGQSYSHLPSNDKSHDHVSSSTGNGVVPVPRIGLKENRQIDEQFHPQALLSLWIEAQAALCSMKYENHILRMKLQKDVDRNEQL